jgi:S1-C subfamily serine protease
LGSPKKQAFRLAWLILGAWATGFVSAGAGEIGPVYKRVRSSVVVVATEQREPSRSGAPGLVSVGGMGSGVLISEDGKVLTAAHVVQTAERIVVETLGGELMRARVVASHPFADVALLQLESAPSDAQPAPLGDSDEVEVGDQIFVVGAPFGISHSLTVGHVSARRLEDEIFDGMLVTEMFQTDAAINQGNSGGPMFNLQGEVIGVVSHILSHSGGFEGLGFVITSNTARKLLLEGKSVWSGLEGYVLRGELAEILNLPQPTGLLVQRVARGSPAWKLGLRGGSVRATVGDLDLVLGGDVVLELEGIDVGAPELAGQVLERLRALRPGDSIRLRVLRSGEVIEMEHHLSAEDLPPTADGP